MERIVDFAKKVLYHNAQGAYVDFTMGNGNDTLFFSRFAPEGKVYAFDIQPAALDSTQRLLEASGVPVDRWDTGSGSSCGRGEAGARRPAEQPAAPVTLILDSHSHVDRYGIGPIDGGMFNLGYLPRGDKSITTLRPTTLEAIQKALSMLKKDGVLVVAVYPGHPEGELEGRMVQSFASRLNKYYFNVILYRYINHPGSAFLFAFEKSKEGLPEGWTDWCRSQWEELASSHSLERENRGEERGL